MRRVNKKGDESDNTIRVVIYSRVKENDSKKAAKFSTIPISIRPLIEEEPIYTTSWESPPRGDTI